MAKKSRRRILILPDIHFPFADWKAIKQAHRFAETFKPDLVVQLGDITDQKAWSRWPTDTDDFPADHEFSLAYDDMLKLHDLFPKMTILVGNHDLRLLNKRLEAGIPRQVIKSIEEIFDFKGWTWHPYTKGPFTVDTRTGPVTFMHGDEAGGTALDKAKSLSHSVVQGHTHRASLSYHSTFNHQIFGMQCGCLMDQTSKGARYAVRNPVSCFVGFAVIEDGVPRLIPCHP